MDTRGNFYLGIRLPTKDNADKPKLTKKERLRVNTKNWKKNNPDKYKEHQEYVKEWKRNNKDRVRQTHKDWYQKNRDWLLEYYKNYHHNKKRDKKSSSSA